MFFNASARTVLDASDPVSFFTTVADKLLRSTFDFGVTNIPGLSDGRHFCYSAGVMVLSKEHPQNILYRSTEPVLAPELPQERRVTIANVVFPTGIDRRDDLGTPDRFDVYYGMADNRIGVAHLDLPEYLPAGAPADSTATTQP